MKYFFKKCVLMQTFANLQTEHLNNKKFTTGNSQLLYLTKYQYCIGMVYYRYDIIALKVSIMNFLKVV